MERDVRAVVLAGKEVVADDHLFLAVLGRVDEPALARRAREREARVLEPRHHPARSDGRQPATEQGEPQPNPDQRAPHPAGLYTARSVKLKQETRRAKWPAWNTTTR